MMKGARLFLGLAVSGLCLWLVLSGFLGGSNVTDIMGKIGNINVMWASLALGSLMLAYPLNAMRLKYVLTVDAAISCRFSQVLPIVWVSSFLSLALPSAAFSDGIRATLLRATKLSNLSLAIRAVLVDLAMGLIYTLGLAGLLLLILPANINPGLSNYWGLVFMSGFLGAAAAVFLGEKLVNKVQLFARLRNLFKDMRHLMNNPKAVIIFLGFAVANTVISALCLWFIARGFSVDVSFWTFFMLTPAILIVNNLPIFYQGFGGREATMLFAFGNSSSGMSPELILTISLVSGIAIMGAALIGSVFLPFLLLRRNALPLA